MSGTDQRLRSNEDMDIKMAILNIALSTSEKANICKWACMAYVNWCSTIHT